MGHMCPISKIATIVGIIGFEAIFFRSGASYSVQGGFVPKSFHFFGDSREHKEA